MNYIQTLANLDAKLSRYDKRLEKMKHNISKFENIPSFRDWDITSRKIEKMERLYSKVGRRALQQVQLDRCKKRNRTQDLSSYVKIDWNRR